MGRDFDVQVIGNYCHDTLVGGDGQVYHEGLGGSPGYMAAIFSALKVNFKIYAKVGSDFKYLEEVGRSDRTLPIQIEGARTTSFVDLFFRGERTETIISNCEPIHPRDLSTSAKVTVLCGVAKEILPETLLKVRDSSDFILCDIQGLIREIDPSGRVFHKRMVETPFFSLLNRIDYLKTNFTEALSLDLRNVKNQTRILLTNGFEGSTYLHKKEHFDVPAFKVNSKDPTGAGDSFLAGFSYGILKGWSTRKAVLFANFCGGLAVQQIGIPKLAFGDFKPFFDEEAVRDPHALRI